MNNIVSITSIISNLSSFGVLIIAIWALTFKRKEIFRNHLTNKQIDSLLDLRDKLNRIVYDSFYAKIWADNIRLLDRSLADFEKDQPEDFRQHKKMQYDLIWLNRMIDQKSFHLFPDDFDELKLKEYGEYLRCQVQPYSILKFSELSQEQVNEFQNKTLTLIKYIEGLVKKLGK
jgi:hydroxymethylpyrimidine pyrophosphatase-like HAD family hydrolase